ncbi:hypothetical protein [Marinobacter nauticus]|uniref:hypothetical protein n=1 Tax=Marinobacter nauticus TaxID=2743 RepID=UPI00373527D4
MAWETGTAANHVDLFNKIRDFLTTNTDLVNAGENWTQVLGPSGTLVNNDAVTLRGPGTTGNENIYFGMQAIESVASDLYNLRFWGHPSLSAGLEPRDQALKSPDSYILCWNQQMTYWIVANGRRWMLAVKVSTVYSTAYCGFFLPYAAPSEYPYPMVVAGISDRNSRWSDQSERNRFMASPGYGSFWTYYPDNVWRRVTNHDDTTTGFVPLKGSSTKSMGYVFPTMEYGATSMLSPGATDITNGAGDCFDGSYLLRDLTIVCSAKEGPYDAFMGVLDGAYWVPGRGNSTENIVTKDGVDHLVVQNLFRTGFRDYMAMRLA